MGSPLELRCLRLLEGVGFEPQKQFSIFDRASARLLTIADFTFPDGRVAIYVDGASIHLGSVLWRDRRVEQRLAQMEPPWRVLRFRRSDVGAGEILLRQVGSSEIARWYWYGVPGELTGGESEDGTKTLAASRSAQKW